MVELWTTGPSASRGGDVGRTGRRCTVYTVEAAAAEAVDSGQLVHGVAMASAAWRTGGVSSGGQPA